LNLNTKMIELHPLILKKLEKESDDIKELARKALELSQDGNEEYVFDELKSYIRDKTKEQK